MQITLTLNNFKFQRNMPGYGGARAYKITPFKKRSMTDRLKAVRVVGKRVMAPGATRGFYGSAARQQRTMSGVAPPERKVHDVVQAIYSCNNTGTVTLINGIAQGADFTQRIGRKSTFVAIQLEGILQPSSDLTQPTKCRVLLVYDSQPNGVLPPVSDIFDQATSTAFMNLDFRDRFKVLHDCNVSLAQTTDTGATLNAVGAPTVHNLSVYKRINLPTIWSGTTNAIGDIQTGAFYLVTIGNNAATTGYDLVCSTRMRFVDN